MRCICAKKDHDIPLGRTGENDVEAVSFDVKDWPDLYGAGGSFVLVHKRPGDTQPYLCATAVASSGRLVWVIKAEDLQFTGRGEAQLSYVVDSKVAKSVIFTTRISRSLEQEGELPEPYESMIEELIAAAANITTEADRAETARDAAETAQGKAEDAQDAAERSEQNAKRSEDNAEDSATLAQSWAEGGTGTRTGEDTDNAEYWAGLAQQGAEYAGYVYFEVDQSDGCMYVTVAGHIGEDVDFEVNEETGQLEVIYA